MAGVQDVPVSVGRAARHARSIPQGGARGVRWLPRRGDRWFAGAEGGCGAAHNGCVACRACNRDKPNKTLEQWDDELRDLLGGMIMEGDRPVSPGSAKMFRVAFDLASERPGWPPVSTERLWGEKTGTKFEVRLVNTPFFARGISFGDHVQVRPDHERRELVFEQLMSKSGHSTIRIVYLQRNLRGEIEVELQGAGCSFERAGQFEALLAVDVPPSANYLSLRSWLGERAREGILELQEAAISLVHKTQLSNYP